VQEQLLIQLVDLVQGLTEDMKSVKQDTNTLKEDVRGLKQDVETLKQRMDKQEEELYLLKVQMDENTKMVKAIRDNQVEQRSLQDSMMHEIAHIRREMATKEDIIYIHQRLDYQISRIARTEEKLHLLKTHH
jgi:uncharacterized protein YoxC